MYMYIHTYISYKNHPFFTTFRFFFVAFFHISYFLIYTHFRAKEEKVKKKERGAFNFRALTTSCTNHTTSTKIYFYFFCEPYPKENPLI